jgi:hypothetical protein
MIGRKAPYAGNALKVMPIVPSPATFIDHRVSHRIGASSVPLTPSTRC